MQSRTRLRTIQIIAATACLITNIARADDIPACVTPNDMQSVPIPDGIPDALRVHLGKIALPGQAFDATDIVQTGINRRYIFAWHRDNFWIIATEHGGRGYNDPIMAYKISTDGQVTLVDRRLSFPQGVCSDATALAQ